MELNASGQRLLTLSGTFPEHLHQQDTRQVHTSGTHGDASLSRRTAGRPCSARFGPQTLPRAHPEPRPSGWRCHAHCFQHKTLRQAETSKLLPHLLPHSVQLPVPYHVVWKSPILMVTYTNPTFQTYSFLLVLKLLVSSCFLQKIKKARVID